MFDHVSDTNDAPKRRKITRPVVSDEDGMREGGLVFIIVLIVGFIGASMVHPLALTSFWVWFALLMMSVAVASGTQRLVAWFNGYRPVEEEA
ncbi:hypothetical protein [Aestuariivita boseongensis]|uniref:hypothetical protein n=1 Tax=Aestuariivita boseongensis TaxID=1470562 RepID=UPI0006818DB3|nr:hypothetical protein [Aestuariivita boseongensis]